MLVLDWIIHCIQLTTVCEKHLMSKLVHVMSKGVLHLLWHHLEVGHALWVCRG